LPHAGANRPVYASSWKSAVVYLNFQAYRLGI
jgi:hypothetical protein